MRIAELLRCARVDTGASLRATASRVGVNPAYLSRVEQGKVKASKALLRSLSGELGLDEEKILALGGFVPDSWREAVEQSVEYGNLAAPDYIGASPVPDSEIAEPVFPFASRQTVDRLGLISDPLAGLFPLGLVPTPELNEIYELKLALLEAATLTPQEIVDRGAYFVAVDGRPTRHFHICTGGGVQLPRDSGARLRSFIGSHQFKTSYATHGLFPYRGKFHPQMVKAILNVMGLRPGDSVLDPMAGSGTTAVEAALMGLDAVAIDASPFCEFLARTKMAALEADLSPLWPLLDDPAKLRRTHSALANEQGKERVRDPGYKPRGMSRAAFDLLALAFLDAQGYAMRSSRKGEFEFFVDILGKYVSTVRRFQEAWAAVASPLGAASISRGDARRLELPDESIDGVLFSPPYSFAIDYLKNDASHLSYLGYEAAELRPTMVGLNGGRRAAQVKAYFDDMALVLAEVARVLRSGNRCSLVVGSNANQLARALDREPDDAEVRFGIEGRLIETAASCGLDLELAIRRLIVGMANSMREEHILIMRKGA